MTINATNQNLHLLLGVPLDVTVELGTLKNVGTRYFEIEHRLGCRT